MTLVHDLLRTTAATAPGRVFLICDGRRLTFADVDEASDRVAADLQRGGVARGDRVALLADNGAEFVVALFGVLKSGAVLVPVAPTATAERIANLLRDCGARALVAASRFGAVAGAVLAHAPSVERVLWTTAQPDDGPAGRCLPEIVAGPRGRLADPCAIDQDLFAIIYTSGSTGRPKGVMLTHRNLVNTTWSIATYLANTPDDVVSCFLPLTHTYGMTQVLVAARVGHAVVLERSFAYPYDVLHRVAEHRVTGFPAVPTVYAQLLHMAPFADIDLSSLRYFTNAAAGLPSAHVQRLQALFPHTAVFLMYGQTECTRTAYLDPSRVLDRPGSVGRAIPNSETWIVGEDGRRVGPGVTGELVVRGANVMRGYWGLPDETARSLRDGGIPGEKVLHTGDRFRTDEEGLLYFVGRSDDVFKCRGEKVSPFEVEQALHELTDVVQAAVVGVEDAADGRAVKATLVLRADSTLTERDVRRHCRSRLEAHLVPKFVEFRDAMPQTDGGKLDRGALARSAEGAAQGRG